MLNPDPITDTIVEVLQSLTPVVTAMAGEKARIQAFHYEYGVDSSLMKALYELKPPAILIAWDGTQGGNFDGMTIWKHRFCAYMRLANQAQASSRIGYATLWTLMMNSGPVQSWDNLQGKNVRDVQIFENLDIMDTPSVARRMDEELMDFFVGTMVFPEIGDN